MRCGIGKRLLAACAVLLALGIARPTSRALSEPVRAAAVKREIVCGTLGPDGRLLRACVVNCFQVSEAGWLFDYGDYTDICSFERNPTLRKDGMRVSACVPEGEFRYVGALNARILPWKVRVRYWLDGASVLPEELHGRSGSLQMQLTIEPSDAVLPAFALHYDLHVEILLDAQCFRHIRSPDAGQIRTPGGILLQSVVPAGSGSAWMIWTAETRGCIPPYFRIVGRRADLPSPVTSYASIQNKAVAEVVFQLACSNDVQLLTS